MNDTAPSPAPEPSALAPRERYFNRELSWLAFNRRVLEEAENPRHPLLERLRFLSISGSNLDEFFMVRVAGLKAHQLLGVEELSADGLIESQQRVWGELREALAKSAMMVLEDGDIDPAADEWLERYFRNEIF